MCHLRLQVSGNSLLMDVHNMLWLLMFVFCCCCRHAFPAFSRPPGGRPVPRRRETCTTTRTFVVHNTFTAAFGCLKSSSTVSPNANEMHELSCQGLGKKRHTVDKDGERTYLRKELEKLYPKLKAARGKFQLYKSLSGGSGRRALHKIPMGPAGYSIKWLCENVMIGSANIYVMPLLTLPDDQELQQDTVNLVRLCLNHSVFYTHITTHKL